MQTAIQKADQWVKDQNMIYSDGMVRSLALLIEEQDKETRHACAEAVATTDGCRTSNDNAIYNSIGDIVNKAVCADQARSACMNVKAL